MVYIAFRMLASVVSGFIIGLAVPLSFAASPVSDQSVPASFDCNAAKRPVDRFLCTHAVLRWQDLALSRSYRAARADISDSRREALLNEQRNWLRERDRACIGDRSFEALSGEAKSATLKCLEQAYLQRRLALQTYIGPLVLSDIQELDLTPIMRARPELAADGTVPVADVELSPEGSTLALLLPSLDTDFTDQVWLYVMATHQLLAASPPPFTGTPPMPEGAPAGITQTAWKDGMFYSRIALWNTEGDGEEGQTTVYSANADGFRDIEQVDGAIYLLLQDGDRRNPTVQQSDVPEHLWGYLDDFEENDRFLIWHEDRGNGMIELSARERPVDAPPYLVAWGSWELSHHILDKTHSLLAYPGDTGILLFDPATRLERRLTGASRGDRPLAFSVGAGWIVWKTLHHCGAETLDDVSEDTPEHLCLARLPVLEGGRVPN